MDSECGSGYLSSRVEPPNKESPFFAHLPPPMGERVLKVFLELEMKMEEIITIRFGLLGIEEGV